MLNFINKNVLCLAPLLSELLQCIYKVFNSARFINLDLKLLTLVRYDTKGLLVNEGTDLKKNVLLDSSDRLIASFNL